MFARPRHREHSRLREKVDTPRLRDTLCSVRKMHQQPSGFLKILGAGWKCPNYYKRSTCIDSGCEWVPEASSRKRHSWGVPGQQGGGRCQRPSVAFAQRQPQKSHEEGLQDWQQKREKLWRRSDSSKKAQKQLAKETERYYAAIRRKEARRHPQKS